MTRKPLLAVNHLEAHALTARLTDGLAFPYLLLLVSGGHTQLVAVRGVGDYVRLGTTIDDAIGEAFDKVAKLLGLPYPGGPEVERMAEAGDPERFALPRPMLGRPRGGLLPVRPEDRRADRGRAHRAARRARRRRPVRRLPGGGGRRRGGPRPGRPAGLPEVAGRPTALVAAGGVAANGAIRRALAALAGEAASASWPRPWRSAATTAR